MIDSVVNELNKDPQRPSPLTEALLKQAKAFVKQSRSQMSKHYDNWDFQDSVYRGERPPDNEDLRQEAKGNPTKMIVPNTYAQCQVFISFLFLLFKQNRTFFEWTPMGDEDGGTKKRDIELITEHDLRKSQFNTVLYQHLNDVAVRGPGFLACDWVRRTSRLRTGPQAVATNINGITVNTYSGSEWQDFVKFEGNEVRAISPYRAFPDTNFPLTEALRRGRFFAYEEEYSMAELRDMAAAGEIAGVENIRPLSEGWSKERGAATRTVSDFNVRQGTSGTVACGSAEKEGPVLVTKVRMRIVPHKFEYDTNKTLGPEEFPVMYHVWYANDNTVIRVEPAEEWHDAFGVTLSQFTPDMHHTVSTGLAELVYRMQDVISWLLNTHMKSVRRVIQNRLVINTDAVESRSLDGEGDIYLKKGFGRRPVSDALQQLNVQDVTGGHMTDAQIITSMMSLVTGVNDNLQGQISSGRRSAQENRVTTASAAGRMKLHGHLIWDTGLGPLGEMMISNSRQSLSMEYFNQVIGAAAQADPNRYVAYKGTPQEVICGCDYLTWDSTLASEKGFAAQSLQELISTILSVNPMAAQQLAMSLDVTKMIDEVQYLRGAPNPGQFRYAPGTAPVMPPPALVQNNNAA